MKTFLSGATTVALAIGLLGSSVVVVNATDLNPKNEARPSSGDHIQGASGISGWAVVDSDATLVRNLNAKSATSLSTGAYEVRFNSNITKCAYTGTVAHVGHTGVFDTTASVLITGRSGNAKALYVETFDSSGAHADEPFHVVVTC